MLYYKGRFIYGTKAKVDAVLSIFAKPFRVLAMTNGARPVEKRKYSNMFILYSEDALKS